jgi:glycosyltransferase involved in cell wall biosynthesis
MSRQLQNTLFTLSAEFQQGVESGDYEVIVLENSSSDNLAPDVVASLPANFRYVLREEAGATPVPAVNEGFALCRAPFICLMIDGARLVSPGVIRTALAAQAITEDAVVAVPGYHLGRQEQHLADDGLDLEREEIELMASVDWRVDGYELFRISTFSGANRHGYLHPIMECNCLFASAANYQAIGYANSDFTLPGGGSINLHMYRSLGMLPHSEMFVLPGEGSFHQYHGGVTTSSYEEREAEIEKHRVQLHSYWPGGFHSLRREPTLLGQLPVQARPFFAESLQRSRNRIRRILDRGLEPWPDDAVEARASGSR